MRLEDGIMLSCDMWDLVDDVTEMTGSGVVVLSGTGACFMRPSRVKRFIKSAWTAVETAPCTLTVVCMHVIVTKDFAWWR